MIPSPSAANPDPPPEGEGERAHRIEALGRLAGGVAHDFNNLLTVIRGNAQLLLAEVAPASRQREELTELVEAADRAATLTRQLLAFSRQQLLQPVILDLNDVVAGVWPMLQRLAGDRVVAEQGLGHPLGAVLADPGQLEEVLMNLVLNARDALPEGGRVRIETANVSVDAPLAARHPPMPPGEFVRLAVSDTGVGMDEATLARVFQPFFTTKPLGEGDGGGRGMGLATVYGIVKQSGGYIFAESASGAGATFRIYLPRVAAPVGEVVRAPDAASRAPGGSETVLVVEDERLVRAFTRRTLARAGYRVVEATNGAEALRITRTLARPPDLLITDLVMPVMGGRALASALQRECPTVRVLFVSGYTNEREAKLSGTHGALHFLPKPFTVDQLRTRVRALLDRPSTPA